MCSCRHRLQAGRAHTFAPYSASSCAYKEDSRRRDLHVWQSRQPGTNRQSCTQTHSVPSRPGRSSAPKLFICQSVRVCATPPPHTHTPIHARTHRRAQSRRLCHIFNEACLQRYQIPARLGGGGGCVGATKHKLFPREPVKTRCAAS